MIPKVHNLVMKVAESEVFLPFCSSGVLQVNVARWQSSNGVALRSTGAPGTGQ